MEFWKMNGAGNDFIIINNFKGNIPAEKFPYIAETLCERHLSIGADGFMVVAQPSEEYKDKADFKMLFFNSDGSLGEMCGNGARCICRYGYETGLSGETQRIETTAGLVTGKRISERTYKIRLNDPSVIKLDEEIKVGNKSVRASYVELGDPGIPHSVVEIKDLEKYPLDKLFELGRSIRFYEGYPKGANVNFYELIGDDHIIEKTYERGVEDFTYACGTGTGSVVAALTLKGLVSGKDVKVDVRGGRLNVDIDRDKKDPGHINNIYLKGPTNIVAKGDVLDEELEL
ncbi:MAG: diaminopimelate epimerase [Firmicutes bacterium]|jgi:diaminopimelate epimerase|nr:diaminopimelate epimerase [Bacillota bacterium]MEE3382410.1 diaminopimelate epimerase [Anaerovoracaceae bacterium]MBQ1431060.1 diaminopimelate epimerase [Bacillota bacterium]MBQ1716153.1 diaminopimelate epimerase [Bacillota bacterium]MBQ6607625.1 diaminopimelate epimerase [Bacillota bacterium]